MDLLEDPLYPPDIKRHYEDPVRDYQTLEYTLPPEIRYDMRQQKAVRPQRSPRITLPCRLNAPLIAYPQFLKDYLKTYRFPVTETIRQSVIDDLQSVVRMIQNIGGSPKAYAPVLEISDLRVFLSQEAQVPDDRLLDRAVFSASLRIVAREFEIAAGDKNWREPPMTDSVSYPRLLGFLKRVRQDHSRGQLPVIYDHTAGDVKVTQTIESGNCRVTIGAGKYRGYFLITATTAMAFLHQQTGKAYIFPIEYQDYMVAFLETMLNLDLLLKLSELQPYHAVIEFIRQLLSNPGDHNACVSFAKNFEALCLYYSDLQGRETLVNWTPIIDTIEVLNEAQIVLGYRPTQPVQAYAAYMRGVDYGVGGDLLGNLLTILAELDGHQLQEVASLHKNALYSEVDELEGIEHFLKRTHTPRTIDPGADVELACMFKQEFICSYARRYTRLPPLEGNAKKVLDLCSIPDLNTAITAVMGKTLDYFEDLRIRDALSNKHSREPLEYSKDKGALNHEIHFMPTDSDRELLMVVRAEDYNAVKDFNFDHFRQRWDSRHYVTTSSEDPRHHEYVIRGCMKEKEQRPRGRMFGVAALDHKHTVSRYMALAKDVLGHIDGEMMTISDEKRKEKLHSAAQILAQPDTFSILLDIEGHNQSMQAVNTGKLLEAVGDCVGITDFDLLANYFHNCTVYYCHKHLDRVDISVGQLGGIEGFYNPLWTLHTVMAVKRALRVIGIEILALLVYSDDVNIVVRLENRNQESINNLFRQIQEKMLEVGLVCKMSQTGISKTRATLLRQNYFKGVRADMTMKKLLAVSEFAGSVIHSEELCINSVVSGCSSAIEISNHPLACYMFMIVRLLYCSIRLIGQALNEKRLDSLLTPENLPIQIASKFHHLDRGIGSDNRIFKDTRAVYGIHQMLMERRFDDAGLTDEDIRKRVFEAFGLPAQAVVGISYVDVLHYCLKAVPEFQDLVHFILMMPTMAGGLGVQGLMNIAVSGNSDGYYKALHHVRRLIETSTPREYLRRVFANTFNRLRYQIPSPEAKAAMTCWPKAYAIKSAEALLKSKVKERMRAECRNQGLKDLFATDAVKDEFATKIVTALAQKFNYRIAQFYMDSSIFHIVDALVAKVDTSTGIVNRLDDPLDIARECSRITKSSIQQMFELKGVAPFELRTIDNVLRALQELRSESYPHVTFDNIDEPLYEEMLQPTPSPVPFISCGLTDATLVKDGVRIRARPKMGSFATYKGEIRTQDVRYQSCREYLASSLTTVTRWMVMNSGMPFIKALQEDEHRYVICARATLSTLTTTSLEELVSASGVPVGGEIRHRIPNVRFTVTSYSRCLPNEIVSLATCVDPGVMAEMELSDSNLNVDLLRNRVLMSMALNNKYGRPVLKRKYNFYNDLTVKDVRIDSGNDKAAHFTVPEEATKTSTPIDLPYFNALTVAILDDPDLPMGVPNEERKDAEVWALRQEKQYVAAIVESLCQNTFYVGPIVNDDQVLRPYVVRYANSCGIAYDEAETRLNELIEEYMKESLQSANKSTVDVNRAKILEEVMAVESQDSALFEEFIGSGKAYLLKIDQNRHGALKALLAVKWSNLSETDKLRIAKIAGLYILCKVCLVVRQMGARLTVDRDATLEQAQLASRNLEKVLDSHDIVSVLCGAIGEMYPDYGLKNYYRQHIETVSSIVDVMAVAITNAPELRIGVDQGVVRRPEEYLHLFPRGVRMGYYLLPEYGHEVLQGLSRNVKMIQSICDMYADPRMANSVTGSDSMIVQATLYETLYRMHVIGKTESVKLLAAGRGDGLYGLEAIGFTDVRAYNRTDDYVAQAGHPRLIKLPGFELADPSTYPPGPSCAVHVDCSFMGRVQVNGYDIMANLAQNHEIVTIRMNSLDWGTITEEHKDALGSGKMFLFFTNKSNLQAYQLYVVWTKTRLSEQLRTCPAYSSENLLKWVLFNYVRIRKYLYLLASPTEGVRNSLTVDLSENKVEHLFETYLQAPDAFVPPSPLIRHMETITKWMTGLKVPFVVMRDMIADGTGRNLTVKEENWLTTLEIGPADARPADNVLCRGWAPNDVRLNKLRDREKLWDANHKGLMYSVTFKDIESKDCPVKHLISRFPRHSHRSAYGALRFYANTLFAGNLDFTLSDLTLKVLNTVSNPLEITGNGIILRDLMPYIAHAVITGDPQYVTKQLLVNKTIALSDYRRQAKLIGAWRKIVPWMEILRRDYRAGTEVAAQAMRAAAAAKTNKLMKEEEVYRQEDYVPPCDNHKFMEALLGQTMDIFSRGFNLLPPDVGVEDEPIKKAIAIVKDQGPVYLPSEQGAKGQASTRVDFDLEQFVLPPFTEDEMFCEDAADEDWQ